MIPLKLTIRNFLPYSDKVPPLDFTGIHTATISGDNGSGKSSIIDAITWALWGEARAKKDDDLIHSGQSETEVDLEFAVSQQKYRVNRRRARPKKLGASGQTQLHIFIYSDEVQRALDGDTMWQTQKKIEDILHMDYVTFSNSAYLRQGHADEFTTSTPTNRKKVLANILRLERYDELERRARELSTMRKISKDQLQTTLAEMDKELLLLPCYESEMERIKIATAVIESSVGILEFTTTNLQRKKAAIESHKNELMQIDQAINIEKQQMTLLQNQVSQLQVRIKEHELILSKKDEIAAGYMQFVEVKNKNDILHQNLMLFNRFNQKRYELEKIIELEKQKLIRALTLEQSQIAENKKNSSEILHWREELKLSHEQLAIFAQQDEHLQKKKQNIQELIGQIRTLDNEKSRLESEVAEINEKLHLLKNQIGKAKCPMCGCDLGENGVQHIEKEYENEKSKRNDLIRQDVADIKSKQNMLKILSTETALLEKSLGQEKARLQGKQGGLEKDIARADEAMDRLEEAESREIEIIGQLNNNNYAVPQRAQLRQLETEIFKLDYDSQKHEIVRQLLDKLQSFELPKRKLDEAEKQITIEKASAAELNNMILQMQAHLDANEQKKLLLLPEVALLGDLSTEILQKETELKSLNLQRHQALIKMGDIKGRLEHLQNQRIKRNDRAEQLNLAASEEQVYRDLGEAFGKKGVQALIIEQALPEIENEANWLLSKMTDGRMNVKFETQGSTQKGDITETLDIKISDELGTRDYEMFSGGEAFRINFSIRIALSRLLARRAGTPLKTLIIDEGFGTQDAAGIEKLKEAIVSIQDDFEKILVITHIDELKDAFPARIDVIKTSDGSMISLS